MVEELKKANPNCKIEWDEIPPKTDTQTAK
jgi:hypothetical protein